jgi:glutamate carboxypeptidase
MQARQGEMVDLLFRLALAESPTDRPDVHAQVQDLLTRQLVAAGCQVDRLDGGEQGAHLVARGRNGTDDRPTQLLVGHYDTVWPMDTLRTMPVRLENGRLSGPGVYDMKGGLVLIIYALRALEQLRLEPSVTPLVFMNSDEEIGSPTSTSHIERLARSADRALILEPAQGPSGKIKTARKGVGRFKVRIQGVAAHAGVEPERGASAVLELAHLVQRLHALNDPERGISVNVGVISGGNRSNVVAADSLADVDIRAYHETEAMEIRDAVLAIEPVTPGVRIAMEDWDFRQALERTPRNRALWEVTRRTGRLVGLELEETAVGGGSDGNTTSLHTATIDGLGPVGAGSHAAHEYVEADSLPERAALLALLMLAPPLGAG